jgi:hypothetical protein
MMLPAVSLTLADPPEGGQIHVVPADTAARANTICLMPEFPPNDDRSQIGVQIVRFIERSIG